MQSFFYPVTYSVTTGSESPKFSQSVKKVKRHAPLGAKTANENSPDKDANWPADD
jgi:hypothetical protein